MSNRYNYIVTTLVLLNMLCCTTLISLSQTSIPGEGKKEKQVTPLQVGDTIPETLWRLPLAVLNHKEGKKSITLEDYRSKRLIILDFGGTMCPPCIVSLKHLGALEDVFSGELTTIAVSSQTKNSIAQFLQRQPLQVPYVYEDSQLKEYFPHSIIPHLVWIRDNRVFQISGAEDATTEALGLAIRGERLDISLKSDIYDYDLYKPLIVDNNGGTSEDLAFQSIVTHYQPGIPGGFDIWDEGMTYRNTPVYELYSAVITRLHSDQGLRLRNRVIFDLDEQAKTSIHQNRYSYSFYIKGGKGNRKDKGNWNEWFAIALSTLNSYFPLQLGIRADLDMITTSCLVLKKNETPASDAIDFEGSGVDRQKFIHIQEQKASAIASTMGKILQDLDTPFLSDLDGSAILSLSFPGEFTDLKSFNAILGKQGFSLVEEKRSISIIRFIHTN